MLLLKKSYLGAAFCAAVIVTAASSYASANSLIADGDFSNPSGGGGFTTISAGSSFGPWTVTSGSIDLIGGYWQSPTSGGGSVDMDGNNPGTIIQSFIAPTTGTYDLTFFLSGNPDGGNPLKTLDVSVGLANQIFTYTTGSNTHGDMLYVPELLTFGAVAGLNTLQFSSLDDPSSPYGPVIGDVSLAATPLPSTWTMLIAGFAGLGFLAYGGSKKGAAALAAA